MSWDGQAKATAAPARWRAAAATSRCPGDRPAAAGARHRAALPDLTATPSDHGDDRDRTTAHAGRSQRAQARTLRPHAPAGPAAGTGPGGAVPGRSARQTPRPARVRIPHGPGDGATAVPRPRRAPGAPPWLPPATEQTPPPGSHLRSLPSRQTA
ncbi:hypothetical protein GCM10023324_65060 [Streptomyces youssoufiensis]